MHQIACQTKGTVIPDRKYDILFVISKAVMIKGFQGLFFGGVFLCTRLPFLSVGLVSDLPH